jgi:hypothetical protein
VEGANNTPMVLMLLPFLSSGFVPTKTLPTGLRWFAEYQPFTPITDLLRALLRDQPVGAAAWQTVAWCLGLALVGYLWGRAELRTREVTARRGNRPFGVHGPARRLASRLRSHARTRATGGKVEAGTCQRSARWSSCGATP